MKNPEYAAVRHILSSPSIAGRSVPYIGDDDFDWGGLLAEAELMSSGERTLVRVAHDLWEAGGAVGVAELPRRLDRRNLERVLDALRIFHGEPLRDAA
jgi:hypothetical protein